MLRDLLGAKGNENYLGAVGLVIDNQCIGIGFPLKT